MKRLLSLWLTLLAAFWLARAGAAALLFGRVESGWPALAELAAIPALQAAVLSWITRRTEGVRAARAAAAANAAAANAAAIKTAAAGGADEPPAAGPALDSGPPPPYKRAPQRPRPGGGESS